MSTSMQAYVVCLAEQQRLVRRTAPTPTTESHVPIIDISLSTDDVALNTCYERSSSVCPTTTMTDEGHPPRKVLNTIGIYSGTRFNKGGNSVSAIFVV